MKSIIITILFSIFAFNPSLRAQNKNTEDEVYRTEFIKYTELMEIRASYKLMIPQLLYNYREGMGAKVPEKYWLEMEKEIGGAEIDTLLEHLVPIYKKCFPLTDLQELNKFLSSPAGRSFVKAQAQVQLESVTVAEDWSRLLSEKIIAKLERDGYGLK